MPALEVEARRQASPSAAPQGWFGVYTTSDAEGVVTSGGQVVVTSRYPLWDMKSPRLTADVPHTKAGEERMEVDIAGNEIGTAKAMPESYHSAPATSPCPCGDIGTRIGNTRAVPVVRRSARPRYQRRGLGTSALLGLLALTLGAP